MITEVFQDPVLAKAKQSIEKAGLFKKRSRMFVRRWQLEAIIDNVKDDEDKTVYVMLYLLAYVFLLRVPSEALPAIAFGGGGVQSSLAWDGDALVLQLGRRKNKPEGSRLVRYCWCSSSQVC